MSSKIKPWINALISILFWLSVWEIAALVVNNDFFLPGIPKTLVTLWGLFGKKSFFTTISATFLRVILGLLIGIVTGTLLAVLSHHFSIVNAIISPFVSVVKATPVASFIILLWVSMDGNALTIFIAFLMVFPIIWQNLMDAYNSISKELTEIADIFEFSFSKRMKYLILPALSKYLAPAVITSVGLAWKSEIAAEIIAYTAKSIGQYINDAKQAYDTPSVFAWTLLVIIFSISLEKLTKFILKRCRV